MSDANKRQKRETNALATFFHSYLFDKLDNTLKADSFILSEDRLPAVLDLKDELEVYS